MSTALLFIGHGTRDELGVHECMALTHAIEKQLGAQHLLIERAFLEIVDPDIPTGFRRCIERGATRVVLCPLLLFAAGHWKRDIPKEIRVLATRYPNISIEKSIALGLDSGMIQVVVERLLNAGFTSSDRLLMVARGNRDAKAFVEFQQLAMKVSQAVGATSVKTAVMTGMGSTIEEGLSACQAFDGQRIFVVPYLLFHGLVLDELQHRALAWGSENSTGELIVVPPLWPHPAISLAFASRVLQVLGAP